MQCCYFEYVIKGNVTKILKVPLQPHCVLRHGLDTSCTKLWGPVTPDHNPWTFLTKQQYRAPPTAINSACNNDTDEHISKKNF